MMGRWTWIHYFVTLVHYGMVAESLSTAPTITIDNNNNNNKIAVFGCGVLGTSLCQQLLSSSDFDSKQVIGITKTSNRHDAIRGAVTAASSSSSSSERFSVETYEEAISSTTSTTKFRDVVFCAPPSGFDDYPAAIQNVMDNLWAGPSAGGQFVFTSSGGIYGQGDDGATVTEDTPVADVEQNPRVAKLVNAERVCREGGGCVLRLAGLYTLERGAHNYWLESGNDVRGRADGWINLLHYDDAAGACLAALSSTLSMAGNVCLVSDGHPTTRKGICESARKATMYSQKPMPTFLGGPNDSLGKIYDGTKTNAALNWKPRYSSFDTFMMSHQSS